MYQSSKTAFFYYHSSILVLRGEHKLCGLKREGGGKAAGGRGGQAGRLRIMKLRSRFRPVQISSPRVPGSSDEAVRLPSPSPRTGCSLCSSLPHKAQLPVYKQRCHLVASSLSLPLFPRSRVCSCSKQASVPFAPAELTVLTVWLRPRSHLYAAALIIKS